MTTLTYKEQLLHPNWQRKRLEILQRADYTCESCGATDKTLHVHHKRYVKGRLVWDYEAGDLACLCSDCHSISHEHKAAIEAELARYEPFEGPLVHALLAGFRNAIPAGADVPEGMADVQLFDGDEVRAAYLAGRIAELALNALTPSEQDDLAFLLCFPETLCKALPALKAQAQAAREAQIAAMKDRPLDDLDLI